MQRARISTSPKYSLWRVRVELLPGACVTARRYITIAEEDSDNAMSSLIYDGISVKVRTEGIRILGEG